MSTERHRTATGAGRRRGEMHRADGDRRFGQIIKARREAATHRVVSGRTAASWAVQILATCSFRLHTTKQAA